MLEEILIFLEQKKRIIGYVIFSLTLVFLVAYPIYLFKSKPQVRGISTVTAEISGAVKKPGVYTLESGKRVEDLITLAGGILKDADQDFVAETINRARILEDGEKIFIPFAKTASSTTASSSVSSQKASSTTSSNSSTSIGSIVNINTATLSELDTLPGIGPVYSQRIIDYRTQKGGFKTKEEIKEIKGIGDATYEKIRDLISI